MTTWFNGTSETLVLAWAGTDGVYMASGMEQNGVISATPVANISTPERFAMVELEPGLLVLSYMGTDNQVWPVRSVEAISAIHAVAASLIAMVIVAPRQ
jgi:hypothetical protein